MWRADKSPPADANGWQQLLFASQPEPLIEHLWVAVRECLSDYRQTCLPTDPAQSPQGVDARTRIHRRVAEDRIEAGTGFGVVALYRRQRPESRPALSLVAPRRRFQEGGAQAGNLHRLLKVGSTGCPIGCVEQPQHVLKAVAVPPIAQGDGRGPAHPVTLVIQGGAQRFDSWLSQSGQTAEGFPTAIPTPRRWC